MSDRLNIDSKIGERSSDFYYSASDMFGVDVFTDDFREELRETKSIVSSKNESLLTELFSEEFVESGPFDSFEGQMFMTKRYEAKYHENNSITGTFLSIILCTFAGIISLGLCVFITNVVKKKESK